MRFEFQLPDLGEGIATAEVIEWAVAVGGQIELDATLVTVETDKMASELPSPVAGVLAEQRFAEGDTAPVGGVLAVIETADDVAVSPAQAAQAPALVEPPVEVVAVDGGQSAAPPRRPRAAPSVRKLALDAGLDLGAVAGTGPDGRIVAADVRRRLAGGDTTGRGVASRAAAIAPRATSEPERIPLRGLRRRIAQNMTESWQRIPQAVDYREVDATNLLAARRALMAVEPSVTFVALMVKICAAALSRNPLLNAQLDEERDEIVAHRAINIGVATATPDGVIVPVIHGADQLTVPEIARRAAELTELTRARKTTMEDLKGGTFTVNNTGALSPVGGWFPNPLINWPESAILAFGRISERVFAIDGQPVVRPGMLLTCVADHRLVDGAELAAFTNDVVQLMAEPTLLLAEPRA